jgi:hypothetical protein
MAHIVAFDLAHPELAKKREADGLTVSHTCHNTACCNPAHLKLATIRENAAANRGRQDISGEANSQSKITAAVAKGIKRLIAEGFGTMEIQQRIKAEFGAEVPRTIITDIKRGRTWRNLADG